MQKFFCYMVCLDYATNTTGCTCSYWHSGGGTMTRQSLHVAMMSSWRKDRGISNCYAVMGHMWNARVLGGGEGGFDLVMGLQDHKQRQSITACICSYVVLA